MSCREHRNEDFSKETSEAFTCSECLLRYYEGNPKDAIWDLIQSRQVILQLRKEIESLEKEAKISEKKSNLPPAVKFSETPSCSLREQWEESGEDIEIFCEAIACGKISRRKAVELILKTINRSKIPKKYRVFDTIDSWVSGKSIDKQKTAKLFKKLHADCEEEENDIDGLWRTLELLDLTIEDQQDDEFVESIFNILDSLALESDEKSVKDIITLEEICALQGFSPDDPERDYSDWDPQRNKESNIIYARELR